MNKPVANKITRSLSTALILAGAIVVTASADHGQPDGVDHPIVINDECMRDIAGFDLQCSSNDISIASVISFEEIDPCEVVPNGVDTATFTAVFEVLLTAQERHDIGLYFATDGDPNGDGALTGACTIATPAYTPDPPWLDLDGTNDPLPGENTPSGIQDVCGDIDDSHNPLGGDPPAGIELTLTVQCVDTDGDGFVNVPNCASWRQPGSNDLCLDPTDAFPGSPAKCNCDDGFNVPLPLPFDGTIQVDKVLIPADDPGRFELEIIGVFIEPNIGNGGTTGAQMVSAGDSQQADPGETYMVRESAAGGTDLSKYDTTISCIDQDGDTANASNAGPVDVFVQGRPEADGGGDDWVCTITNTRRPAHLTLNKIIQTNNGGTAVVADFTLTANGPTPLSGAGGVARSAVNPGIYSLSETGPSGYSASAWNCDGGSLNGNQLTLDSNDDVTCTITNDDQPPSLTLVKVVTNDNGGTAVADQWTLTASGPTGFSGTTGVSSDAGFDAGTYNLSESGPAGYNASDWVCVGGTQNDGDTITVALGESATCTITNNDKPPSLTLVKVVTNDNGGTAVADQWTLTASGPTGFSGTTGVSSDAGFDAGTYNLSEAGPAGYNASDWVCVGGTQNDGDTITVALGESATCTITNDDQPPGLTLFKSLINDNGGTAQVLDWTLAASGPTGFAGTSGVSGGAAFQAGTYDLSEIGPAGYSASAWLCVGGTQNDSDTITVGLGESASCTITNDDISPTLTLIKTVVNNNGGTAGANDFGLAIDGNGVTSGAVNPVDAGAHTASETALAGYNAGDWGGDCNADGTITLALAQNATCTITNDDQPPSLTLVKVLDNGANPGGTAIVSDWTLTATGPTGFSGTTGVSSGAGFFHGTYDLSEAGPAGYVASDWNCVGGTQDDADTITVSLGESATCTITNTARSMVTLLKLTNGIENETMTWDFTLTGPEVDETDSSPPTTVDFGGAKLVPGETYSVCETGIPAGWLTQWRIDTDGDGVPDTIIPHVLGVNNDPIDPGTGYSRVFDPNFVVGDYVNDTRCVKFRSDAGEMLAFQINNQAPPDGDTRTIGYWKNWSTCSNGNQAQTAARNGGAAEGFFLLDDLLPQLIGVKLFETCEEARLILDKRDVSSSRKMASDGAYNLAAQLMAAQLNFAAGAASCPAATTAATSGQALLASIGFDGTGRYLRPKDGSSYGEAVGLANLLDQYNNGTLCGPAVLTAPGGAKQSGDAATVPASGSSSGGSGGGGGGAPNPVLLLALTGLLGWRLQRRPL